MNKKKTSELLITFVIAGLIALGAMLPTLIKNDWAMILYNDFNTQTIPFQMMMNHAIKNHTNGWIPYLDLGSELVGSMAFYGIGSPFTWITWLFSENSYPYLLPWIIVFKYAFAAVTAHIYINYHGVDNKYSRIGAILYAFSGYQAINIMFYCFHDTVAFFPIVLLSLDKIIDSKNSKRGFFAVAICIAAILNYYLFAEEVIFCIIYFLCRITWQKRIWIKAFLTCIIEGIIGVMMAGAILVPVFNTLNGNPRLSAKIAKDVWFNIERRDLLYLFRIFCFPGETMGNQFCIGEGDFSSNAAYLPMIGIVGVAIFLIYSKEKINNWLWKILVVLIPFIFIPLLNSSFGAFNESNYRRWYFMLILMMSLASVKVLSDNSVIKRGRWIIIIMMLGISASVPAFIWWNNNSFQLIYRNREFNIISAIGIAGIVILFIASLINKYKKIYTAILTVSIAIFATITTGYTIKDYTDLNILNAKQYMQNLNGYSKIKDYIEDGYRLEILDNCATIANEIPGTRSFSSTISSSINTYYESIGYERHVFSPEVSEEINDFLSAKYYLTTEETNDKLLTQLDTIPAYKLYEKSSNIKKNYLSTPYDIGFSAFVNGVEVEITNDNGMIAFEADETDEIELRYFDKAFMYGCLVSILGIVGLILYKRLRDGKKV